MAYDNQKAAGSSVFSYRFLPIKQAIFEEDLAKLTAKLNADFLTLDVDYVSFDATGKYTFDSSSTANVEYKDGNSDGSHLSECFYSTTYIKAYNGRKYNSKNSSYEVDSTKYGDHPEYIVYVTLKLTEGFFVDDKPSFK